jgi:N-dimethylarginine dimethylaminohydrolase
VAKHEAAGISSVSMYSSVLMCPPTFFDVREPKNPHMGMPIDRVLAQHQWENLHRAMVDAGLKVELIDPVKELDDMVFTANQAFTGEHPDLGKFIVPSRMRYRSRQAEVAFFVEWFRKRGYKVIQLELGDDYLEGHGDLLWHPDRSRVWAGYGFRSTRGGVDKFVAAMEKIGFPVTPLELVDEYCYHLDTCFCALNEASVMICPEALSVQAVDAIRNGFERIYELSRDEARKFIGNGIVVNGRYVTPRLSDNLCQILASEGLQPVVVNTSEFEKSGGSVFCMKTFLS